MWVFSMCPSYDFLLLLLLLLVFDNNDDDDDNCYYYCFKLCISSVFTYSWLERSGVLL